MKLRFDFFWLSSAVEFGQDSQGILNEIQISQKRNFEILK